jgi:hypothetical protein
MPEAPKQLLLLLVSGGAFVVTAVLLTCVLFRDGNDSTRSFTRYADTRGWPVPSRSFFWNRFKLLFFLSAFAAISAYQLLPRFLPALFQPLPTQSQSKR